MVVPGGTQQRLIAASNTAEPPAAAPARRPQLACSACASVGVPASAVAPRHHGPQRCSQTEGARRASAAVSCGLRPAGCLRAVSRHGSLLHQWQALLDTHACPQRPPALAAAARRHCASRRRPRPTSRHSGNVAQCGAPPAGPAGEEEGLPAARQRLPQEGGHAQGAGSGCSKATSQPLPQWQPSRSALSLPRFGLCLRLTMRDPPIPIAHCSNCARRLRSATPMSFILPWRRRGPWTACMSRAARRPTSTLR